MNEEQMKAEFEAFLATQMPAFPPELLFELRENGEYVSLVAHYSWKAWQAAIASQAKSAPVGWVKAADEELVMAFLGVADYEDDYDTAKSKLDQLIQWHIAVATDPAVNGGYSLQQEQPTDERVRELEAKYNELIMAVASKFPNETRHETALRYIRNAEASAVASCRGNRDE